MSRGNVYHEYGHEYLFVLYDKNYIHKNRSVILGDYQPSASKKSRYKIKVVLNCD